MKIKETLLQMIDRENALRVPITDATNLYLDLHFDSLTFVYLLAAIEDKYGITIELPEMSGCTQVGQLITLVETKAEAGEKS